MSEIKQVARRDPVLGAEGAVLFLERISPAIEQVDSSSGAIGTAVNRAVGELAVIIARAPADSVTRDGWLERLWDAYANDEIPYIEQLGEHWAELCVTKETASAWADRLFDTTRLALSADRNHRGHFPGSIVCLVALFHAERWAEILDILKEETFWHYKRWEVKSLAALGRKAEAIRLAESCRGPWTTDHDVDRLCEGILLSSGLVEEAYARYGFGANRGGTYLSTFRAVARAYPHKPKEEILADLVRSSPGGEGKWFATAKDLKMLTHAVELARTSPCDPRTLARAARDHARSEPEFALEVGCIAIQRIVDGFGYEITSADVWMAAKAALEAAESLGRVEEARERIRGSTRTGPNAEFVARVLGSKLGTGG